MAYDDKPLVLGNGVKVAAGVKGLDNIEIGNNAIIGANAVVTKRVLADEIVDGEPAHKIGENNEDRLYG